MPASVADLVDLLRKSRLLDAARLEKVVKAQDRFPDAVTLAKELVRRGWLTRDQAQALLQGRPAPATAVTARPAAAPVVTANGTPAPVAPVATPAAPPRRRAGWLLALLALVALLLLAGGGVSVLVGVLWYQHGKGNPADSGLVRGSATGRVEESPTLSCSDTSALKTLDDLEFGDSVPAQFDPKLLDALKADAIPELERYPAWQPPNLVAILGEHRMRGTIVAASPDGTALAVAGRDAFIRVGPIDTLHEKAVLGGFANTYALAWSPKGDVLASSGHDGRVRLWDVRNLGRVPEPLVLPNKGGAVTSLSFSHDGKYLLGGGPSGSDNPGRGVLWLWDAETRQEVYSKVQPAPVQCVAFSPAAGDYRALWGGGPGDGQLYLWDGVSGKELAHIDFRHNHKKEDEKSYVSRVAFSPDGKLAASAHYDWNLDTGRGESLARAWDLDHFERGKEKRVLKDVIPGSEPLLAFAPDNRTAAVARLGDGSVALWDVAGDGTTRRVARSRSVNALLFLARGEGKEDRLAFAGAVLAEWNVHVHGAATGKELRPPTGHLEMVLAVAGSPDGANLISGGYEGQARVWDLGKAAERFAVTPGGQVGSVGFHPDGRKAYYCGSATPIVPFVDVGTGQPWGPAAFDERHNGGITNAAVTEDGNYVLSGGHNDGTVRLWSLKHSKQARYFPSAAPGAASVALSPNGKRALRSSGTSLKLLHLRCQEERHEWVGAAWNTFLPDDGYVAILGGPSGALWDVSGDKPKEAGSLHIGLQGAQPGGVSHDGRRLAAVVAGRVNVWDRKSEKVLWDWTPPAHFGGVPAVALSDDGRYLFTANGDGTVYVIQLPQ